jgi:hypothetical protein
MSKELLETIELASMASLFIFASFVILGLACESEHFHPRTNWVGESLVIIGVAGQTLVLGGVFFSSRRLLAIDEHQVEILQKRAADAELRAASLSSIITGFDLTPPQLGKLAKLREQFRGTRIAIGALAEDTTGASVASQIRNALEKEGGLEVTSLPDGMPRMRQLDWGIHIYSPANDRLKSALTDALKGGIMPVFNHPVAELPATPSTRVSVIISAKICRSAAKAQF